jgi:hypothetical protein
MRTRRHFQPSLDLLPMRLAPSGMVVSPMSQLSGVSNSSTATVSPMNNLSGAEDGASVSDPSLIGPGTFTAPSTTASLC